MNTNWFALRWGQLKDEARVFSSQAAMLRIIADLLSVNVAMVLAYILWQFADSRVQRGAGHALDAAAVTHFIFAYGWMWSLIALAVFQLHGFYTRTRGYADPYKALVIVRAVTVFIFAFVFAGYFVYSRSLFPRELAVLSWVLVLAAIGGSRIVANWLESVAPLRPPGAAAKGETVLVVGGRTDLERAGLDRQQH